MVAVRSGARLSAAVRGSASELNFWPGHQRRRQVEWGRTGDRGAVGESGNRSLADEVGSVVQCAPHVRVLLGKAATTFDCPRNGGVLGGLRTGCVGVGPLVRDLLGGLLSHARIGYDPSEHVEHVDVVASNMGRLGVEVACGVDVEHVGFATAGGRDVQRFPLRRRRDEGVGCVDGLALGAMGRSGVPELDMVAHVIRWQRCAPAPAGPRHRESTPAVDADDGPGVAVLDPSTARGQGSVVVAGDDQVADRFLVSQLGEYTSATPKVYSWCMAKVRTNIEIEDSYVEAVMDRYGVRTKTEAVDLALRHLAGQPMTREEALAMRGAHAIGETPSEVAPTPAA